MMEWNKKAAGYKQGKKGLEDSPQPSKETSLANNLISASFQENMEKLPCCCPHGGTVLQLPWEFVKIRDSSHNLMTFEKLHSGYISSRAF